MNTPKLHHYVPRFYLNGFTDQKQRFWAWDKSTKRSFCTTPNRVAAESHFYRIPELIGSECDPLFLERELSELEGTASAILRVWIDELHSIRAKDRLSISQYDRWEMATFIAVQFLRTSEQRDILALFASETGHHETGVSSDEKINLHARALCSGGLVEAIADRINQSIWIFARNKTPVPFWTSDNPVSFKTGDNRMWLKGPGIMSSGSYVVFPITPCYVLYCKESEYWVKLRTFDCCLSPVELTTGMVEQENTGQIFMASRFVLSPLNEFALANKFVETIGTDVYAPKND